MPQQFDDVGDCVDAVLRRVGKRVVLAVPLALGNPVLLVNELYRRAFRDRSIELNIFTGLSLRKPQASGELERRFLDPFVARVFGNYPELDYVAAVRAGQVPSNIEVIEFFLEPGAYLGNAYAQQHYLSANYTHVTREVLAHGVNVVAQMIATRVSEGRTEYSLSCNPDVTVDLLPELDAARRGGREIVTIGVVNRQLPFMFGGAEIAESVLDFVVEHSRYDYDLYCAPNLAIGTVDYLIGLYASALVKDAGTLQIGIGELGDAIVYCLQMRHQHNATWQSVLDDCRVRERFGPQIEQIGDTERFERGLYGCTEMFVDGFLDSIDPESSSGACIATRLSNGCSTKARSLNASTLEPSHGYSRRDCRRSSMKPHSRPCSRWVSLRPSAAYRAAASALHRANRCRRTSRTR